MRKKIKILEMKQAAKTGAYLATIFLLPIIISAELAPLWTILLIITDFTWMLEFGMSATADYKQIQKLKNVLISVRNECEERKAG